MGFQHCSLSSTFMAFYMMMILYSVSTVLKTAKLVNDHMQSIYATSLHISGRAVLIFQHVFLFSKPLAIYYNGAHISIVLVEKPDQPFRF